MTILTRKELLRELVSLGINRLSDLKRYTRDAEAYLSMRINVYYNDTNMTGSAVKTSRPDLKGRD